MERIIGPESRTPCTSAAAHPPSDESGGTNGRSNSRSSRGFSRLVAVVQRPRTSWKSLPSANIALVAPAVSHSPRVPILGVGSRGASEIGSIASHLIGPLCSMTAVVRASYPQTRRPAAGLHSISAEYRVQTCRRWAKQRVRRSAGQATPRYASMTAGSLSSSLPEPVLVTLPVSRM